jgi:energy-coupling factor transporter ATP-binding protein EcfA2
MSLTVKDIYYRYPGADEDVLKGVSAEFAPGSVTAVLGKNGCGKTTLVKILIGMLKPESGAVLLHGEDLSLKTVAQRGRKIGCVMQNPGSQMIGLTVREEMAYGLRNQGLAEPEIENKIMNYLDYFELSHCIDQYPLHLSLGEQQRLMLAVFLALEPSYIVLDEPTSALDGQRKSLLGSFLKKSCEKDCGIILISHDQSFVMKYGDRDLILDFGVIRSGVRL